MKGHEQIEELYALEALDALDAEDREALARGRVEHGPECAECAELQRACGDVAGRLAFALDPVNVRHEIAQEVLGTGREVPLRPAGRRRRALLAAAAAVLIGVGALGGYLLAPGRPAELESVARFVSRPDVQLFRFQGPSGNLVAAVAPQEGFLFGSDLPALSPGRVYELWIIRDQISSKGLCLEPRNGVVAARFEADVRGSDALAVTVEPSSCPSQPSTEPVFLAQFRA
jgi:Anti-sigma-K factor rskA